MEKGSVYKTYYPVDEETRKEILKKESVEEVDAYFDFLQDCIENKKCSDCNDDIEFDETWTKDEIYEYQFSALCRFCQKEQFGI